MPVLAPGDIIRRRREDRGLTREQLVAQVDGLSVSTLIRIELRGGLPRARTLANLANALGLTVDEVLLATEQVAS